MASRTSKPLSNPHGHSSAADSNVVGFLPDLDDDGDGLMAFPAVSDMWETIPDPMLGQGAISISTTESSSGGESDGSQSDEMSSKQKLRTGTAADAHGPERTGKSKAKATRGAEAGLSTMQKRERNKIAQKEYRERNKRKGSELEQQAKALAGKVRELEKEVESKSELALRLQQREYELALAQQELRLLKMERRLPKGHGWDDDEQLRQIPAEVCDRFHAQAQDVVGKLALILDSDNDGSAMIKHERHLHMWRPWRRGQITVTVPPPRTGKEHSDNDAQLTAAQMQPHSLMREVQLRSILEELENVFRTAPRFCLRRMIRKAKRWAAGGAKRRKSTNRGNSQLNMSAAEAFAASLLAENSGVNSVVLRQIAENREHLGDHLACNGGARNRLNAEAAAAAAAAAAAVENGADLLTGDAEANANSLDTPLPRNSHAHRIEQTMVQLRQNLAEEIEIRSAHTWNFLSLLPSNHAARLLVAALAPSSTETSGSDSMTLHSLVEDVTLRIAEHRRNELDLPFKVQHMQENARLASQRT